MSDTIQEFKDKCVIIKVKPETVSVRGIYGAVRWAWKGNLDRARRVDYVLAVEAGIVIGVFKPTEWYRATGENDIKYKHCLNEGGPDAIRIAFQGEEANNDVKNHYLNKCIPYKFKRPGMANPFIYITIRMVHVNFGTWRLFCFCVLQKDRHIKGIRINFPRYAYIIGRKFYPLFNSVIFNDIIHGF